MVARQDALRRIATTIRSSENTTHVAPTQPRASGPPWTRAIEPSAAPSEKPMNIEDAFRESATGATLTPASAISLACCAAKKAQADTPQPAIATSTGTRALDLDSQQALADRLMNASARAASLTTRNAAGPHLSVRLPPPPTPAAAAMPHLNRPTPT